VLRSTRRCLPCSLSYLLHFFVAVSFWSHGYNWWVVVPCPWAQFSKWNEEEINLYLSVRTSATNLWRLAKGSRMTLRLESRVDWTDFSACRWLFEWLWVSNSTKLWSIFQGNSFRHIYFDKPWETISSLIPTCCPSQWPVTKCLTILEIGGQFLIHSWLMVYTCCFRWRQGTFCILIASIELRFKLMLRVLPVRQILETVVKEPKYRCAAKANPDWEIISQHINAIDVKPFFMDFITRVLGSLSLIVHLKNWKCLLFSFQNVWR
jgi:hypothetical protein